MTLRVSLEVSWEGRKAAGGGISSSADCRISHGPDNARDIDAPTSSLFSSLAGESYERFPQGPSAAPGPGIVIEADDSSECRTTRSVQVSLRTNCVSITSASTRAS
jgi:hypothetical protein